MSKSHWNIASIILFVVVPAIFLTHYILADSPVSDSFTDTSKIASSVGLTVDTENGQVTLATAPSFSCGDPLTDARDSQTYDTVLIGSQCWMAENLNVGTRVAGSAASGTDCPTAASIEKYCYGDSDANCTTYGAFYQWSQAMCGSTTAGATGICPLGWHFPTDAEWYTLESGLWDSSGSCSASRSASYGCNSSKVALTTGGASGFEAIYAGFRASNGSFLSLGNAIYYWSSTETSTNAWYRSMDTGNVGIQRAAGAKTLGFAVRCVQD